MRHAMLATAATLCTMLAGCATYGGLEPPLADLRSIASPEEQERIKQLQQAMTDTDIADLLDVRVRPRLPSGLALARLRNRCGGYQPCLDTIDAEELSGWEQAVNKQPAITSVRPVNPLLHGDGAPTLRSLRLAAAKMGCELLLVYLQADNSVDNLNDAAVLYWTVIGLWLVPGNVYEHRTVMQAVLMDTRTGAVLGTSTGDSHLKRLYPAMFKSIQRDTLSRRAPREALTDLQTGTARMLAGLAPAQAQAD